MNNQPKTPARASGIPRLASRLPLPTTSATSKPLRPSPSREKLQLDPGLGADRLRKPSEDTVFKKPFPKYTAPQKFSAGLRPKNESQTRAGGNIKSEVSTRMSATPTLEKDGIPVEDNEVRGRTRPSLAERTIETLSKIPPSPGPARRQSSFFGATSPMRSPSRPSSSMTSYSRSPSKSSSRQPSGSDYLARPSSAMCLPSRPRPSSSTNSASDDRGLAPTTTTCPPKMKMPSTRMSGSRGNSNLTSVATKPRLALTQTHMNAVGSGSDDSLPRLEVKKTRRVQPKLSASRQSSVGPRSPSARSTASDLTSEQRSEMETRKVSKSSSALRESIAKAKAARKAEVEKRMQLSSADDAWKRIDTEDPFNQRPQDSHFELLRKRLETGRTSGHLNIADLSLKELPKEVLAMYDFDPDATTEWYQSVDLVKFIAADNEFTELPDEAFPDIDPHDLNEDAEGMGNQFGGLELLDLHGNLLQSLPIGLRRLRRLHTLNLSNNNLEMNDVQVVMEISSLRDLKLAKNHLKGPLTSEIKNLTKLETLDLHDNFLTDLPSEMSALRSLRVLDVGGNQLSSLQLDALSQLSLKELRASKNKLKDALVPSSIHKLEALQVLDIANNTLFKLSENMSLELPSLRTLAMSSNRIQSLPDLSSWQALLTLSAEDNSLSTIPDGFIHLKNVRTVDFSGNDISKLDDRIGLMDSLFTFRIANNPLRERKFLTMGTEDLKRDLRNRCEPEYQDTDDDAGSVATQFTLAPETPAQTAAWKIKPGGVLDRSYTDMRELELDELRRINLNEVRCLYLHHNELRYFPVSALSLLASTLTDLDLSNNPLDSAALFVSALTLPNLHSLNLSSTNLTTLDPILTHLEAPALTFLDVSYNRLSGPVPAVRRTYPTMIAFLATDNRFTSLEFGAAQGLQVLDVGNNDIGMLPPKLGLLRGEGSSRNWDNGSALRRFEVAGNSFRVPRWQIVAKGTDAVLEWLKDRMTVQALSEYEPHDELTEDLYDT
ncbi:uncharacterized protein BP01DRAFT_355019 [Aspergillus saccharolyticus JOP 1030-1]|uniref:Leucine-rich repeat protein n=1 Tax=Aspergillus saccharolyticus JOP 1030-1 TaxID=1450539 RepID=A0A318ZTE1_9EURO|nr:leucine-rich repeat protein [Aspergillus saccharolyticus JOP 1030-1]PYH47240.1 leucine-rich repeat protein [Aspergillus saccharolyticus JOP 1030-1]